MGINSMLCILWMSVCRRRLRWRLRWPDLRTGILNSHHSECDYPPPSFRLAVYCQRSWNNIFHRLWIEFDLCSKFLVAQNPKIDSTYLICRPTSGSQLIKNFNQQKILYHHQMRYKKLVGVPLTLLWNSMDPSFLDSMEKSGMVTVKV